MYQKMLFYTEDDLYTMWRDGHEEGVEGKNQDLAIHIHSKN